jgi:hypothetical protein
LGAQQILVKCNGGSGTRKEVETTQGKEGADETIAPKFEGEGVKAIPLEARTG